MNPTTVAEDDEATILDSPLPEAIVRPKATAAAQATGTRPESAGAKAKKRPEPRATSAEVGGEDAFILAWGRSNEALRSKSRQLALSMVLNVALGGTCGFLAWRNEKKETLVFVRDSLGHVVQADAHSFLHAGDARSEAEIKGFMRRWVIDAFSWTPLDVEDRLKSSLRLVDPKAQPVAREGLRLAERKALVDAGTSGRVHDERSSGREPQVVITGTSPLEVMVSFDRYLVDRTGAPTEVGRLFVRTVLREVPRTATNPNGLLLADVQISESL
jgi:hypothetical protein